MKKKAFTLIELLIVVAIIAILAAIAVPNFLEAQVRSKVSRAQADMRTVATALESYAVDHNRYPIGYINIRESGNSAFPSGNSDRTPYAMSRLTTPVAYLTSILVDPFTIGSFTFDRGQTLISKTGIPYWYDDYQQWPYFSGFNGHPYLRFNRIRNAGYIWSLSSAGPAGSTMPMWHALDGEVFANANNHIIYAYDPTNGSVSEGFVARTNKGVFTEINQP